jgi:Family of unknown function (DUF5947)
MTAALRRFREPKAVVRAGERCEMCAAPISAEHSHVVDIESRGIQCTCRPCYLLFTSDGAAGGRRRAVPSRYLHDPHFSLAERVWQSAGIPVSMAFLFVNSVAASTVAFYPSPAGATESMLPGEAWDELLSENPAFADIRPDVEALLINRFTRDTAGFEAFLTPIDVCYELVGLVRLRWKGFDGGSEARSAIEAFFEGLRQRSEQVGAENV